MTFSANVKNELANLTPNARHCNIAEILGIINTIGHIKLINGCYYLWLLTENSLAIKKFENLLVETFRDINKIPYEILVKKSKLNLHYNYYLVIKNKNNKLMQLFKALGFTDNNVLNDTLINEYVKKKVNPLIVNLPCCKRAYIRGCFLSGGSMSDPTKSYHIEFLNHHESLCHELQLLINSFDLNAKLVKRKQQYVVYVKDGEQISDLLNIMQAHNALLDWENIRVVKNVRNSLNRTVNCETANIGKITSASVNQIEDIMIIEKHKGLSYLKEPLEEIARLRLMHQDASLKEMGEMLTPVVGKSGVNHRFRKISEIAESIRGGLL